MANLGELHVPQDADAYTTWAIREEFWMRWRSYLLARVREQLEVRA